MTHVCVKRLATGYAQEYAAEDEDPRTARMAQELHRVTRIERGHDGGVSNDRGHAESGDHQKPEQHHRPEGAADFFGTEALRGEQRDQDGHRHRHDERLEGIGDDVEALERAQYRYRRSDDAV